jgi:hypothetical protein
VTDTPSKSRRFSRRALLIFGLLLTLLCFFVWNLRNPSHDHQIEAIRALGFPVTLKELDEWYRKPPDADNAALIYTNAFEKISTASNVFDQIIAWNAPVRGQPIGIEDKEELAALFATNQEPLVLLDSAVARAKCRYPIDLTRGEAVLLPHLILSKRSVQILTVRAMLETANGDSEAAVRSFLSAGRLAASLSEEPVVISQLVEIANWADLCKRLEWALSATNFSPDQLERLQKMFTAAENGAFYRGFVGEQASGYAMFSDSKSRKVLLSPRLPPSRADLLKIQLGIGMLQTLGIFKKDKAFYLHTMSNVVAVAQLPFPERFTAIQSINFVPPSRFYVISGMLLPALGKALTRDAKRCGMIRATEAVLAIERFRRANSNSVPEGLSELVPTYLPAIPDDPFDGKALRFKKRDRGYVVYSVGSDLQDDGGTERDPNKTGVRSDITFIVDH